MIDKVNVTKIDTQPMNNHSVTLFNLTVEAQKWDIVSQYTIQ